MYVLSEAPKMASASLFHTQRSFFKAHDFVKITELRMQFLPRKMV